MAKPKSSGNAWELSVIYRLYWRTNWKTINMQGAWNISFLFNEKISRGSVRLNQTTMFCPTKSYRRNAYSLSFHLHDTSQKVLFPSHVFSIFCRLSALNYTERERERERVQISHIFSPAAFFQHWKGVCGGGQPDKYFIWGILTLTTYKCLQIYRPELLEVIY